MPGVSGILDGALDRVENGRPTSLANAVTSARLYSWAQPASSERLRPAFFGLVERLVGAPQLDSAY